ncbi:MAG TPA: LysR family transcriptional regulator, partial [Jatrophihabitantaceae bacterium]|nr:LysR family transcriptional regulator [Jatrophihabitantaceae bacterium]
MTIGSDALDVGRLRLLREVALRGSIAAAARSVGLTPSAISQQLMVLEREAGTTLLDRSPRGVVLTGAGHTLSARAGQVLDVLAAARADLDRIAGSLTGPVSVATVASAAAVVVSPAARALGRMNPGVVLTVIVSEPARSLDLLAAADVDLAIVDEYDYVPLALPDQFVATDLCAEPLVLVTTPDAAPSDGSLTTLADLDWVMPPEHAACGLAVRSACRAEGFDPRVRWETDDMLLLVRAVAAGHGVAVLPRMAVATDIAPVRTWPLHTAGLHRRLRAVTRASARSRPVVQAVVDALVAAAAIPVPTDQEDRRTRSSTARDKA